MILGAAATFMFITATLIVHDVRVQPMAVLSAGVGNTTMTMMTTTATTTATTVWLVCSGVTQVGRPFTSTKIELAREELAPWLRKW